MSTHSTRRDQRRSRALRSRARGTILVEALIVSVVLVLFCAGCLALHQLYEAKLQAMHDARALAWGKAFAREGCAPPFDAGNLLRTVISVADDPIGIGLPSTGPVPRAPRASGTWGHVSEEAEHGVVAPSPLSREPVMVSHGMQLACAEPTGSNHGTLLDVALYGVRTLLPNLF